MQCEECFYYLKAANSCSLSKDFTDSCESFSRRVNSAIVVSLDTVINILGFLRRIESDNIELCSEIPSNPERHERDKLLLAASDLITGIHPEFFGYYLQTIQPFMFRECLRLQEAPFCGYVVYVFDYPCGTGTIQIKVYIKNDCVDVISFHKTACRIEDIRRNLERTAVCFGTDSVVCLQERFNLYLAEEKLEDIACTYHHKQLWSVSIDEFMEQYQQKTFSLLASIITDLAYSFIQQSANAETEETGLSATELLKHIVSDRGVSAALQTARLVTEMNLLDPEIVKQLSSLPDVQELADWLNTHHLSLNGE